MLILFDNDKHKEIYRMVKFKVGEGASHFVAYRIHEYIFRVRRGFGASEATLLNKIPMLISTNRVAALLLRISYYSSIAACDTVCRNHWLI